MSASAILILFIYCQCLDARVYVSKESVNERTGNGSDVLSLAPLLAKEFSKFARDELGTMTLQAAFDRLEYEQKPENEAQWDLDSLVDQLSLRLRHYGHLVSNPQGLVIQLYREHKKSPISPRFDCCNLSERDLRYETLYGARVSRRKCCDLIPFNLPVAAFNPGHNLTQRFRRQLEYWPNVKWLYFITAEGLHTEFPAHNFRAATVTSALVESIALAAAVTAAATNGNSGNSEVPDSRQASWQSFVGEENHHQTRNLPSLLTALYDCRSLHQLRHRDVFVRSVVSQPIWLVMVLDQSEVSKTRMLLGQRVARLLLASLSEKDQVALVLASDTTRIATVAGDPDLHLLPATHETKLFLGEHIYGLRGSGVTKTNHTRALLEAFRILHDAVNAQDLNQPNPSVLGPSTDNLMIAYISRGSLDDLQEQNATLRKVTEQQARLGNRVVINTYMPVEEKSATVLFEKTFMNDLATRWNVHSDPVKYRPSDVRPGHFFAINRTADLAETVGRFYEVWLKRRKNETMLNSQVNSTDSKTSSTSKKQTADAHPLPPPPSKLHFSLPHEDLEGKGLVMSISQAFYDRDTFLGVMGVDLHVADLFDQIIHYGGSPASNFVFIVDATSGLIVYHPGGFRDLLINPVSGSQGRRVPPTGSASSESSYHSASGFHEPLLHVDARYLERTPGFENYVLPRIMRGEVKGTVDWLVEIDTETFARIKTTGVWSENVGSLVTSTKEVPGRHIIKVTYRWRRITDPDTQFVVILRSTSSLHSSPARQLVEITPPFDSWYHRLDLFKRDQACLYLRQLATFSSTTIYLPPRTFIRPFEHLTSPSTASTSGAGGSVVGGADDVVMGRGESAEEVRHLVAYLTDQTALISNPGLRVSPSSSPNGSPSATHSESASPSTSSSLSTPDARTDVAVVERIGKFWRQRGAAAIGASALGKFIIRRYVSTDTGVMLMYPGTLMPQGFDATTRPWYARAVGSPGRIVFTEPYLDHGGAGHIVSIAYAIFEGNHSGIHDPKSDRVQAVMAMDVPYRLFNHLLSLWLPAYCTPEVPKPPVTNKTDKTAKTVSSKFPSISGSQKDVSRVLEFLKDYGFRVEANAVSDSEEKDRDMQNSKGSNVEEKKKYAKVDSNSDENVKEDEEKDRGSTKCLLINDRGYLIAHPSFAEPVQGTRALENYHLSHREPLVAADLLNHHLFVRKVACVSHSQRTLERYYVYNTSYDGVVTNSAPGDHCTRYQFTLVPGTNLFVGLVHEASQRQHQHQRIRRSGDSASCSPRSAFCACSTKDRRCLNCGRMEPLECECPCQCPLGVVPSVGLPLNSINTSSGSSYENHPVCMSLSHEAVLLPTPNAAAAASWKALASLPDAPPLCQQSNILSKRVPVASLSEWLSALFPQTYLMSSAQSSSAPLSSGPLVPALGPVDCTAIRSPQRKTECTASIGCEYCLVGLDSKPLTNGGFCAPMGVCFGGVIGSLSPYTSLSSSSTTTKSSSSDPSGISSAPLGFFNEKWPPLVPPPLPPPPRMMMPQPSHENSLPGSSGGFHNFQKIVAPSDSQSAAAAAHFYHYYYYYYYHHNQQYQHLSGQYRDDEDLYTSPYIFARHYFGNRERGGSNAGGLMAAWTNSNPVGPVAGAVLAVFIVLLLGIYCLRHQAANRARQNAAILAAGGSGDCAMTGLLGEDEDPTNQSGCEKNHSVDKVCCCEKPLESGTDKDEPPPTAGAVAVLVKTASASSTTGSGSDEPSVSACDSGSERNVTSPLSPTISAIFGPSSIASSSAGSAGTAAAIIIEGVGVFVKSNAFSNEQLAGVPEEKTEMPLAEFVTDPTAVSPYRVTESSTVGAVRSPGTDDQITTISSSAATTTDHGYVSNDRPSSSCAESSSLADSFVPGASTSSGDKSTREGEAGSPLGSDSDTNAAPAISSGGPWIGTLILGPGMDDVMCAEELENQLMLFSSKRGQQAQPQLRHSQHNRFLPSWRKAYQHYRQLHHQKPSQSQQHSHRNHQQLQLGSQHPLLIPSSSTSYHQTSAQGRSPGVLARFPVLVQPPLSHSILRQAIQVQAQSSQQETSASVPTGDNIV